MSAVSRHVAAERRLQILITLSVCLRIKFRAGIAAFLHAKADEMVQKRICIISIGCRHIRIRRTVIGCVKHRTVRRAIRLPCLCLYRMHHHKHHARQHTQHS